MMKIGDWYLEVGAPSMKSVVIILSNHATNCFVCSSDAGNCLENAGGAVSSTCKSAFHWLKFPMSDSDDENADRLSSMSCRNAS